MHDGIDSQYWQFTRRHGWVVRDRETSSRACPRCGGVIYRMQRRWIDRLFGSRRYRFQCVSPDCRWEDNLPIER